MIHIVIAALIGAGIGVVGTLIFKAKAIALGTKLLSFAENDYDAAVNHVYSFLRLKR